MVWWLPHHPNRRESNDTSQSCRNVSYCVNEKVIPKSGPELVDMPAGWGFWDTPFPFDHPAKSIRLESLRWGVRGRHEVSITNPVFSAWCSGIHWWESYILTYRSPGWQCPCYNLGSCSAGFKFLLVNWGYLFAQRKCTCDIGFQLRKARFSLLMLGKAWVSKVTDMAGTNMFPEAKNHFEMSPFGISRTSGEFSTCQMNRDP